MKTQQKLMKERCARKREASYQLSHWKEIVVRRQVTLAEEIVKTENLPMPKP